MFRKTLLLLLPCMATAQTVEPTLKPDTEVDEMETISVEGEPYNYSAVKFFPEDSSILKDTAAVLQKMPGAYVNRNGALSGIAQYRGLFGSRVNVVADGSKVLESCSNAMDAPMSHMPAGLVDAVTLQRGIVPVSKGIETLGGNIEVMSKNSDKEGFSGSLDLGYSSVNSGKTGSVFLSQKHQQHKLHLGVTREQADDFDFPGGVNYFTGMDRKYYAAGYRFDNQRTEFEFDVNYSDNGENGTPALPMDSTYSKGGISSAALQQRLSSEWSLIGSLSYQDSEHAMDNFRHRNQMAAMYREAFTDLNRQAFSIAGNRNQGNSVLKFGYDFDNTENQAIITNPNNAMFRIVNFDAEKQIHSMFVEYQQQLSQQHSFISGLRWSRVQTDTADVSSSMAMMSTPMGTMHRTLQDRFNQSNRKINDDNVDFMFNWQQNLSKNANLEYGFAIKNRSPSYQERYLWLPMEATAGLADGRRYLGNLNLKPETAYQFELGLNIQSDKLTFTPHLFLHRIHDYIQGTPNTVAPAPAGTLRFNNVDARLYGVDLEFSYQLSPQLSISNVTSYVRGQRMDIDDNLYRIAPPNTRFNFKYQLQKMQLGAELVGALRQNKVSTTNGERATPGFGLLNLSASYHFTAEQSINLEVNNVFDKRYYQHTNGYNRNNANVDVGFNASDITLHRLPSEGRGVLLTYLFSW